MAVACRFGHLGAQLLSSYGASRTSPRGQIRARRHRGHHHIVARPHVWTPLHHLEFLTERTLAPGAVTRRHTGAGRRAHALDSLALDGPRRGLGGALVLEGARQSRRRTASPAAVRARAALCGRGHLRPTASRRPLGAAPTSESACERRPEWPPAAHVKYP